MVEIADAPSKPRGIDIDIKNLPEFVIELSGEIDKAWKGRDPSDLDSYKAVSDEVGLVSTNVIKGALDIYRENGEQSGAGKKVLDFAVSRGVVKQIEDSRKRNPNATLNVAEEFKLASEECARLAREESPLGGVEGLAQGLPIRVGNLVGRKHGWTEEKSIPGIKRGSPY